MEFVNATIGSPSLHRINNAARFCATQTATQDGVHGEKISRIARTRAIQSPQADVDAYERPEIRTSFQKARTKTLFESKITQIKG
jgi:hypothetical protein